MCLFLRNKSFPIFTVSHYDQLTKLFFLVNKQVFQIRVRLKTSENLFSRKQACPLVN